VIFYQLLAGRLPFEGDGMTAIMGAIISKQPKPIPACPPYIWSVIENALAKDPADRFASATEMRKALRRSVSAGSESPTRSLDPIGDISILEDSGSQVVNLTGISSGAPNESQRLSVTVSFTDLTIVGNLSVNYTSGASTGSLSFTPVQNASGTATITVRVNDGGASNNIVSRSFTVIVNPVNDPPTLNEISDLTIDEDSGQQTVSLTGISSGAPNENQTLTVTAVSSSPQIIPNPTVTYSSPANTGTLSFVPATNANGNVTITVTVNDNSASNNIFSRSFSVNVRPVNDLPWISSIANAQTLEDTPISIPFSVSDVETPPDALLFAANSSNEELVSSSDIVFSGSGSNRIVTIRPLTNQFGFATITVSATDSDGAVASTSFELAVDPVNDPPAISTISPRVCASSSVLASAGFS